jgi:16S rRNA (guanine1207-N2)-methyltransferase
MSRHKRSGKSLSAAAVPEFLLSKLRPPVAVVLGSPAEVVNLLASCPAGLAPTCYQMDLHQADRLRGELAARGLVATVTASADLWDLSVPGTEGPGFQTVLYLPARGGERELKIDMVDQAYHILRPGGLFLVWSPYGSDPFFANLLKKVFGRAHTPPHDAREATQSVLWCAREGERPRRRHEVIFQVKIGEGPSCRFVSQPGVFSYGRFDNGARALCEVMEVEPGDRVLDLGCGVGTNGVFASQQSGASGYIAFVDSNTRAIALSDLNARANGVPRFEVFATSTVEGPQEDCFDVVIANPPYFANSAVAHLFIRRARQMLTPQGRFFMVTRQPDEVGEVLLEVFEEAEAVVHRGYTILCA